MNARIFGLCLSFALASASCAAPSASPELGSTSAAIVGGAPDDTSTSAVMIVAKVGKQTGYCSGVVVAPYVVLTAAHCASADAEYSIFLGADYADESARALPTNSVAVSEHHPHPEHSPKTNENDIGVLITKTPIPVSPTPLNRTALGKNDVGREVQIVGYGQTSWDSDAIGRRREAATTIAGLDPTSLAFQGTPNICLFDSGGPTFGKQDGKDVVLGIHFLSTSEKCDALGLDTRVDAYTDFIDGHVEKSVPKAAPTEPTEEEEAIPEEAPLPAAEAASRGPAASGCGVAHASHSSWGSVVALLASLLLVARRRPSRRT